MIRPGAAQLDMGDRVTALQHRPEGDAVDDTRHAQLRRARPDPPARHLTPTARIVLRAPGDTVEVVALLARSQPPQTQHPTVTCVRDQP